MAEPTEKGCRIWLRGITRSTASAGLVAVLGCTGLGAGKMKPEPQPDPAVKLVPSAPYVYANDSTSRVPPELRPRILNLQVSVLHVEVPVESVRSMDKIWSHLRETALDDDTLLRLRRNGFRVGIGNTEWWEPLQEAVNAVQGVIVHAPEPVRSQVGVPTALEMDNGPRDQTLFCVGADGVLNGNTWPASRNVLKLAAMPDAREPDVIRVTLLPEVRQQFAGLRYVQTDSGLAALPREYSHPFDAAGAAIPIRPGEFVVLAPSETARVRGLIGTAILAHRNQDAEFVSYLLIRPEAIYARQS